MNNYYLIEQAKISSTLLENILSSANKLQTHVNVQCANDCETSMLPHTFSILCRPEYKRNYPLETLLGFSKQLYGFFDSASSDSFVPHNRLK